MRCLIILLLATITLPSLSQQNPLARPCTLDSVYRQFDFWIGEWEVFGLNGKKAGDSKIELILDSCIILENWTSAKGNYAGKSYNTYNAVTHQWQQTWVDNKGGSAEFLQGKASTGKIVFITNPQLQPDSTMQIRRLSFFKIDDDKVRQFAEKSVDEGKTWSTEYDLEYRRKK